MTWKLETIAGLELQNEEHTVQLKTCAQIACYEAWRWCSGSILKSVCKALKFKYWCDKWCCIHQGPLTRNLIICDKWCCIPPKLTCVACSVIHLNMWNHPKIPEIPSMERTTYTVYNTKYLKENQWVTSKGKYILCIA